MRAFFPTPMTHTPFADERFIARARLDIVDAPEKADVIILCRLRELTPELMEGRRALVWTHEPFFTLEAPKIIQNHLGGGDVHVFSVWNENVYLDNYYYAPTIRGEPLRPPEPARLANRRAVMFAKHSLAKGQVGGREVSLYPFRTKLALALHEQGLCEIHGLNWPPGVAVGESRHVDRVGSKHSAMSQFPFTICCENAIAKHYVSEKIWEAIAGGCLPLYRSNPAMAGMFPERSFLDLSRPELDAPEKVAAAMLAMSEDEWLTRMAACQQVYVQARKETLRAASRAKTEALILAYLEQGIA
jgi:hypothetical protein